MTLIQGPWRSGMLVFAASLLMIGSATAEPVPCSHLTAEKLSRYNKLGQEALKSYQTEDFQPAIASILELIEICDEDPRLNYNLARAYQRSGNCNMARFWYERVLDVENPLFAPLVISQRDTALESLTELELLCEDSARIRVECEDEGVLLELDGQHFSCPYEGRVTGGKRALLASKEGLQTLSIEVDFNPTFRERVQVPKLRSFNGTLQVQCPSKLSEVVLHSPDGSEMDLDCPGEIPLPPGDYRVDFAGEEHSSTLVVSSGERSSLYMKTVPDGAISSFGMSGWGWLSVGLGVVALGAGAGLEWVAENKRAEVTEPTRVGSDGTLLSITQQEALSLEEDANSLAQTGVIVLSLGGALTVGGIILLILDASKEGSPDDSGLQPSAWIGPQEAFFSLKGSF